MYEKILLKTDLNLRGDCNSKPVIDRHTLLVFDELIMHENWEQDEYKAFNEFCLQNKHAYKVLAISCFTKQVVIGSDVN